MPPDWLARYRAGQRDLVWHELRQFGSAIREPGLIDEAQLVCDEMATRARHNIELIISRLTSAGYRFHLGDEDATPTTPHIPPSATAGEHADWIDERFGPVPLALGSWIRLVGDVWLVGTHPEWPESAAADPLVLQAEGSHNPGYSFRSYLEDFYEAWQDRAANNPAEGPFLLRLAPDRFHKQGLSGGGPYGVIVPDAGAEGIFVGETTMPFVSYLNWVFLSGGFPWPDRFTHGSKVQWSLGKGLLRLLTRGPGRTFCPDTRSL